ncbi:hypothetical protein SY88_21605 [Clostridiales bacterium PH28_bin88]|nr:hypothetical protein SY88_21605 [Clostridiales bacterium PH28_bin88]
MATMIPNIDPFSIENNGERMFYQAANELPNEYTVLYSYKYTSNEHEDAFAKIKEADFVIVHPGLGYLVVEVKQGEISYQNGIWYELKNRGYQPIKKNPVEQAQNAMFAILQLYKERAKTQHFPLKIKYAVCFPECNQVTGLLPSDLDSHSVFLFEDLEKLEDKILRLFDASEKRHEQEAVEVLINKVLAPSFKVFAGLEKQIEMFNQVSRRVLTEEQERILEETELDKRKIFFGAAGTGKTFLAMEKARRLANTGKKVFLTCFNRNLATYFLHYLSTANITCLNFHDYLLKVLQEQGNETAVPENVEERGRFFAETLPTLAFDHFMLLPEEEKFDAIIVDEGQDFQEFWYSCLESMLKADGEFYIFADPNQNLFNTQTEHLKRFAISKQRLTYNLRNTETINQWMTAYLTEGKLKARLQSGMPVSYFSWETPAEEKRLIEREIGRLVSQGIQPKRIVILSPNIKEKSSLAGVNKIKDWSVGGINDSNCIRFATIRSFKGLEADIVFLIGLKKGSLACSDADIYVGGSRARFLLYIFHEKAWSLKRHP